MRGSDLRYLILWTLKPLRGERRTDVSNRESGFESLVVHDIYLQRTRVVGICLNKGTPKPVTPINAIMRVFSLVLRVSIIFTRNFFMKISYALGSQTCGRIVGAVLILL